MKADIGARVHNYIESGEARRWVVFMIQAARTRPSGQPEYSQNPAGCRASVPRLSHRESRTGAVILGNVVQTVGQVLEWQNHQSSTSGH